MFDRIVDYYTRLKPSNIRGDAPCMQHKLVDDILSCVYVPIGRWSEVAEKFIVRRGQWSREERYYYYFFYFYREKNIYSTNLTAVVVCRCTHYCYYIGIVVNTSILHITAATDLEKTENRILRFFMKIVFLSFLTPIPWPNATDRAESMTK